LAKQTETVAVAYFFDLSVVTNKSKIHSESYLQPIRHLQIQNRVVTNKSKIHSESYLQHLP